MKLSCNNNRSFTFFRTAQHTHTHTHTYVHRRTHRLFLDHSTPQINFLTSFVSGDATPKVYYYVISFAFLFTYTFFSFLNFLDEMKRKHLFLNGHRCFSHFSSPTPQMSSPHCNNNNNNNSRTKPNVFKHDVNGNGPPYRAINFCDLVA